MSAPAQRRAARVVALAWGVAAFLGLAALSGGPGISRHEAVALAAARAAPGAAAQPERPPLPALLARAGRATAARLGLPQLVGYRLASALAGGILAALVALLAGNLAGAGAAALAPALLLSAPRLLLPLVQAGPRAAAAAAALAALLAYRRAATSARRPGRAAAGIACAVLFGLALALGLEALAFLAAVVAHAVLLPALLALRSLNEPEVEPTPGWRGARPAPATPVVIDPAPAHPRSALAAAAGMAVAGPAVALALWPWLWTDTLQRAAAALAAASAQSPVLYLGQLVAAGRSPPGYALVVTALALPASLVAAFAAGWLHGLWRLWRSVRAPRLAQGERPSATDELLLLLAAAAPVAAAQLGLPARVPGPGPWLAAFPVLAALAARAIEDAAVAIWSGRARVVAALLAAAALAPSVVASVRAYPDLGAAWGELAGGAPGAATLELPRHDGEAAASLIGEISSHARPGARVHWGSIPAAALEVYAADGRIRPDLVAAASPSEADVVVVPVAGKPRDEEYRAWAALQSTAPVAGAFLDEVPLGWVYARPGAWR